MHEHMQEVAGGDGAATAAPAPAGPPLAATLGRFVAELRAAPPPPEVLEKVRVNLLHNLACTMAAHVTADTVWKLARANGPGPAGLLADGSAVGVEWAAFANAVVMHGRAQDDTLFAARAHIGSAATPAALAVAQREGSSGADLLRALVAAYEVAGTVGELLTLRTTARGLRGSMLYGTLGSAAAVASLLRLDAEATADAIAIATSFAGGLGQAWIDGSSEWRWELGMAARNGILAAQLAAVGEHGAPDAFEGAAGFARAFADVDGWRAPVELELGERWRVLDVIYKPYPVCNITQSPVAAAIALATEHDLAVDEIAAVRCFLHPDDRSYPGTLNRGPFRDVGATLMSAAFGVAAGLKQRGIRLADLRAFDDPVILDLIERTTIEPDDALPELATRVEIDRRDGTTLIRELIPNDATYGWDWDGTLANATTMLAPEIRGGQATLDAVAAVLSRIERLDDVGALVAATVGR
jgi:2-methylcitrate dehydratase PrpD